MAPRRSASRSRAAGLDLQAVAGAAHRARQTNPTANAPRFEMQPRQAVGLPRPLATLMVVGMVCDARQPCSIKLSRQLGVYGQAIGYGLSLTKFRC